MAETPWEVRHWRLVTFLELLEQGYAAEVWAVAGTLGQGIVRLQVDGMVAESAVIHMGEALSRLRQLATKLNLRSVIRHCERIGDYINGDEVAYARLRELMVEALTRTADDLQDLVFLVMPPEGAALLLGTYAEAISLTAPAVARRVFEAMLSAQDSEVAE